MSDTDNDGNIYESPEDADGCILEIDAHDNVLMFTAVNSESNPSIVGIISVYVDVTDVRVMYRKLAEWLAKYE